MCRKTERSHQKFNFVAKSRYTCSCDMYSNLNTKHISAQNLGQRMDNNCLRMLAMCIFSSHMLVFF